ncbi:VCBS repeat-containing protein [Fulvivirga sp. M361]|uniref:FG-GAP repeat domain-containing protein n=1 Tax=Fulvivirga sp. M361 TaxID=2594266 RepID=UPI001623CD29|nr:VCBS repeat-containing protein [Fulvivirga sp. M361]
MYQHSFSQNIFSQEKIIDHTQLIDPIATISADIDNDKDLDILVASAADNKIAWYRNDGNNFSSYQIIKSNAMKISAISSGDIDGDGDMDIIYSSKEENRIVWCQNSNDGDFRYCNTITWYVDKPTAVLLHDIDNDKDLDVISASSGDKKIAWYENVDGLGKFSDQKVVTVLADGANSVYAADVDSDGDSDLLSTSYYDNKVAWYENLNGEGDFSSQQIISTAITYPNSIYAEDLDGDGDKDVLTSSLKGNKVVWYENRDGHGNFNAYRLIATVESGTSVISVDIDGDNDMDVVSASAGDDKITWYENLDGKGEFGNENVLTAEADGANWVFATDLDYDSDMDILSTSHRDQKASIYLNKEGKGIFSDPINISTRTKPVTSIHPVDINSDKTLELLVAAGNEINVYKNSDKLNNLFTTKQNVTITEGSISCVYASDLDNDRDQDIAVSFWDTNKLLWMENVDGEGSFTIKQIIETSGKAMNVVAADLDNDGDLDLLSGSGRKTNWFENLDGKGSFSEEKDITSSPDDPTVVIAIDLDKDKDLDILVASFYMNRITWIKNLGKKNGFSEPILISDQVDGGQSIWAADLDGDNDLDVVSASRKDNKIAWYQNLDGKGTFGDQRVISNNAIWAKAIYSVDLDLDGDQDVLSASSVDNKIAWYQNLDGKGNFGDQIILSSNMIDARVVVAVDLDRDKDIDVIAGSFKDGKIAWFENVLK